MHAASGPLSAASLCRQDAVASLCRLDAAASLCRRSLVILIDPPLWAAHGRRWSHLVSDASLEELHRFANAHGLPLRGFEGDHYDVPEQRYAGVIAAGAVPVSSRELLRRLQVSGLRRPKRRGERVLGSRVDVERGRRIDTVLSAMAPLSPVTRVHLVVRAGHDVLVLADDAGFVLPMVTPAAGEGETHAAQRLLGSLLGLSELPANRLGYLRSVRLGVVADRLGAQAQVESVLQSTAPAPGSGRPPAGPAAAVRWVEGADAAALLPPDLSPLVHGPFAHS